MSMSDEHVQRFKEIYEKKKGEPVSDEEAREAANNLYGLFDILWKSSQEDSRRKRRLKDEPDGFVLEGGYSCGVCRTTDYQGHRTIYYTKWGHLCGECYAAVKNEIIPVFVALDHESFFRDWQLKSYFEIHPQTMRKYVREGKLKARIIPTADGKPHEYIFLRKENPGLIYRYSPERKSWDRNREKVAKRQSREWAKKMRAEFEEEKKKLRKRLNRK